MLFLIELSTRRIEVAGITEAAYSDFANLHPDRSEQPKVNPLHERH